MFGRAASRTSTAWLRHLWVRSRRAIRSITFAPSGFALMRFGGSATIPLAKTPFDG
jgi:hypothetical protein